MAAAADLPEVRFVFVGRWHDDAIEELRALAGDNVEFTGWLSDDDLHAMYGRASVYVQASRHEGFGLAVAEAMLAGCVPVVMNVTAMPEVVGDAGVLIEDQRPEDVAAGIRRALDAGPRGRGAGARADPHRLPHAEPSRRAARDSRSDPARIVPRRQHAAVLSSMDKPPMRSTPDAAPAASRRAREALLLELGALVYELHRSGRRAPELLQAKASALEEIDAQMPAPESPSLPCPHCFTATEPGQLACLNCGETLGAAVARPKRRRAPLLALAAVVALFGAAAAGFAVSELTSDDGGTDSAAAKPAAAEARDSDSPSGGVAGASQAGDDDGPVALAAWPDDQAAFTVILVTSGDEAGARKVAWDAARSGLEAGLLRSDEYVDLGEGFWLVFAGHFATAARAERRAAQLGGRYEGAYPQQVVPKQG